MSSCSTVQSFQVFSKELLSEKEGKGREGKGREGKGREGKGRERLSASINEKPSMIPGCPGAALHY